MLVSFSLLFLFLLACLISDVRESLRKRRVSKLARIICAGIVCAPSAFPSHRGGSVATSRGAGSSSHRTALYSPSSVRPPGSMTVDHVLRISTSADRIGSQLGTRRYR
jgi:hypothetical protein